MNCLYCNKKTSIWGKKYKKYCNIHCKNEYDKKISKKVFKEINCICCNKLYLPKISTSKYCSASCRRKYELDKLLKNLPLKKCSVCKNDFKPYTSLDKFCSFECRKENSKSKRKYRHTKETCLKKSGENNPSYVHGLRMQGKKIDSSGNRLYNRNRDLYKKDMFETHGYLFCEICNKSNTKLETHHIIFRSEKPKHEYLHNKINLILVCVKCHNMFHNKKGNRNDLVIKRQLQNYFGNDILDK